MQSKDLAAFFKATVQNKNLQPFVAANLDLCLWLPGLDTDRFSCVLEQANFRNAGTVWHRVADLRSRIHRHLRPILRVELPEFDKDHRAQL